MTGSETAEQMERRRSLRLDMEQELVTIQWLDQLGNEHLEQMVCIDICNGGIAIESNTILSVESTVDVIINPGDTQSPKHTAQIIRCNEQPSGCFHIGLVFLK